MVSRKVLENTIVRNSEGLAALCEKLGYGKDIKQLQFNNGVYVSSITDFLDDNPGAIEALVEFMMDHHASESEECQCCGEECNEEGECITSDCDNFGKAWDNDGSENDDPEACPGCGCKPGDGITESCNDPGGCGESKLRRGEVHQDK